MHEPSSFNHPNSNEGIEQPLAVHGETHMEKDPTIPKSNKDIKISFNEANSFYYTRKEGPMTINSSITKDFRVENLHLDLIEERCTKFLRLPEKERVSQEYNSKQIIYYTNITFHPKI